MMAAAYFGFVTGIAWVVCFLVLAEACRRKLVDYAFTNHHDVWVETGRPLAGDATRREASFFGSDLAAFATIAWLVKPPPWLPPASSGEVLRRRAVRYLLLAPLGLALGALGVVLAIQYAP